MGKLTALDVARASEGMYGDGGGLWLQVKRGRSWIFRYTFGGKARSLGLGSAAVVPLKRARELALEHRRLIAEGTDPLAHKRARRAAAMADAAGLVTFKEFAEDYIRSHQGAWRSPQHLRQWHSSLRAIAYPVFGDMPVCDITTALILKALKGVWHTTPETARRTRGRIEQILNAAKAAGLRSGENPAAWRGHLETLLPVPRKLQKIQHFAALPYQEVPAFMHALRLRRGIGAHALHFLILTAARTGEVVSARWDEIDLDRRVWIIPGERMKAGREHRVPLSEPAVALLQVLWDTRKSEYVFTGIVGGKMGDSTMLNVLRLMGRPDIVVHGFRSSFRDWAAETTNYQHEVVEMALAHAISNQVEKAYRRGDLFEKRARLMNAWADYCSHQLPTAEVVPIRK